HRVIGGQTAKGSRRRHRSGRSEGGLWLHDGQGSLRRRVTQYRKVLGLDGRHRLVKGSLRLVPGRLDGRRLTVETATTDIGRRQKLAFGHRILGGTQARGHRLTKAGGSTLLYGASGHGIAKGPTTEIGTPGKRNGGRD